jgi:hypothetical protein
MPQIVNPSVPPDPSTTADRYDALVASGGGYRRDHLRLLARRVEVEDNEVRIMGSKSNLLRTLVAISSSGVKSDTPGVPSFVRNGGEGGIRTPDGLAPMPHFECGAFDHSATSPRSWSAVAGAAH